MIFCHVRGRYVGVFIVQVRDDIHFRLCGLPRVRIFQCGEVGFIKGQDGLILQRGVNDSVLVVHPSDLRVSK